jgi:CDP-glycerol glycerophosphotransferase (TagB/SpsB family)
MAQCRADVGESSYWSEIASLQTLDSLLDREKIEFIDYLERVPDEYIPQKEELISKIKQQMQMQQNRRQIHKRQLLNSHQRNSKSSIQQAT